MAKVLIVDDEEKTRGLIKLLINKELDIEIVGEAESGPDALEQLRTKEVDIVISDIRMPVMDGLTFVTKALEYNKELKIIIISAYEEFEYARKAIRLGVCDYILKPIGRDELNKALRDIIKGLEAKKLEEVYVEEIEEPTQVQQIMAYVKNNLSNSELSLTGIASQFYINASYLSRCFKNECGESFVEYLTHIRMEKALWYLEHTNKKAYEIGELVGICDSAYFYKCFKKYKGISINSYRKLLKGSVKQEN